MRKRHALTREHTHSLTPMHSLAYKLTHTHKLSLTRTLSLSSLSHTHNLSRSHIVLLSHIVSNTHSLSHTIKHTLTLFPFSALATHTLILKPLNMNTHTHCLSLSLSLNSVILWTGSQMIIRIVLSLLIGQCSHFTFHIRLESGIRTQLARTNQQCYVLPPITDLNFKTKLRVLRQV